MTFTRNEARGTHLVFQKRRFQGFISEILRVVRLLGEKFTFFNSLGTTKISMSLGLPVYINVVLLINFPEQFKLFFYFKYSRSYKFYNLGDKTFETGFSILISTFLFMLSNIPSGQFKLCFYFKYSRSYKVL